MHLFLYHIHSIPPKNEVTVIRIVLVDDQAAVRRGLKMRLELNRDMQIVGEARDGLDALEVVRALAPDVVVMDIEMPQLDGIQATRQLRATMPNLAIVMLSMRDDADTREQARLAGAGAFVGMTEGTTALLEAIRRAVAKPNEGKK